MKKEKTKQNSMAGIFNGANNEDHNMEQTDEAMNIRAQVEEAHELEMQNKENVLQDKILVEIQKQNVILNDF